MGISSKPTESAKFTLNETDVQKWLKNSAIFFAPFLLVFLLSVQGGTPVREALNVVYLYGLNTGIDLLRKFIAGHAQK